MEALTEFFPQPAEDNVLRVTPELESLLVERFLKAESFRANVFAFRLAQSERVNANQIWSEYRTSQKVVFF